MKMDKKIKLIPTNRLELSFEKPNNLLTIQVEEITLRGYPMSIDADYKTFTISEPCDANIYLIPIENIKYCYQEI